MRDNLEQAVICVVGLGYVGLPLAEAFSKHFKVLGFDIDRDKLKKLSDNNNGQLSLTFNPSEMGKADFIIICVPTPVTKSKEPDLSYVISAAKTVGQNMKKGSVVILESTVYPGVTEEIVCPILEESGLKCGRDFKIAYSPERINPGDKEHNVDRITKVVAGMDPNTTELVDLLYGKIAGQTFKAKNIKTAEAAKVIENIQRDLNIALVNELSLIFEKMGLEMSDVLEAAATKWNFHKYSPGLVGGHCIPVDPYYLVHKAKELGYNPQVILAGRTINDSMPKHVADITIKALNDTCNVINSSKVLIMGLTYKENVADARETPVKGIIKGLKEYGVKVYGFDPYISEADTGNEFDIELLESLDNLKGVAFNAIIVTVAHEAFRKMKLADLATMQNKNPVLIDVRKIYDGEEAREAGFLYRTL